MSGYFDRLLARAGGTATDALPALSALPLAFAPEAEPEPPLAPTAIEIPHARPTTRHRGEPPAAAADPAVPSPVTPRALGRAPAEAPPLLRTWRLDTVLPAAPAAPSFSPAGKAEEVRPIPSAPPRIVPLRDPPGRTLAASRNPLPSQRAAPPLAPAPEPDVQITIGRIDIVVPSSAPPAPHAAQETERQREEAALPSLADYLKARAAR